MTYHCWCWPWRVFVSFTHCKCTLFFLPLHTVLWNSYTLRKWEDMLHLFKGEVIYKLLRILLHGRFIYSSICLCGQSFIYSMDIHFILCAISQYYHILLYFVAQIVSASAMGSFIWLLCPPVDILSWVFVSTSLPSTQQGIPGLSCILPGALISSIREWY